MSGRIINSRGTGQFTKLVIFAISGLTIFGWAFSPFSFFNIHQAKAIATTTVSPVNGTAWDSKWYLKQGSDPQAVLKVQFGADVNGQNLGSVKLTFATTSGTPVWTNGAATSSELLDLATANGGVSFWKDAQTSGFAGYNQFNPGPSYADTQFTLTATSTTFGAANTLIFSPATTTTLATDDIYFIVLKSDTSGVTNTWGFTVGITSTTDIVTSGTDPIIATSTSNQVIIDTVAPYWNGSGTPPQASTSVPVNAPVNYNFSEPLVGGSGSATLRRNTGNVQGGAVTGQSQCDNLQISFGTPSNYACNIHYLLATSTWYSFTVPNTLADFAGNVLATSTVVEFQTGAIDDGTRVSSIPGAAFDESWKLKQGSDPEGVLKIRFGNEVNGQNLTSIRLTFMNATGTPIWPNGAATSSELLDLATSSGGVSFWKETAGTGFSTAQDTQITLSSTSTTFGASNTLVISPGAPLALATNDTYYIALKSDASGVTNGNGFVVGIVDEFGDITTSVNSPVFASSTSRTIFIDTVAPTVTGGGPPSNQTDTPIEAFVDKTFSEGIDVSTATTTNVSLQTNTGNTQFGAPTGSNLCTTITVDNQNAHIVCNHSLLATSTWYTVTWGTGLIDAAKNPLVAAATSTFQTGSFGGGNNFNPPPIVQGTVPNSGSSLPANGKIKIYFSANMATGGNGAVNTTTNIILKLVDSNGAVTGSNLLACAATSTDCNMGWNSALKELTIWPGKKVTDGTASTGGTALVANSSYRLIIKGDNNGFNTGGCGGACVTDANGLPLGGPDYMFDFTTVSNDTTPPSFQAMFPINGSIGVDRVLADVGVSFNETIDPSSVNSTTVKFYSDNGNDTFSAGEETEITNPSGVTLATDPFPQGFHLSPTTILGASTTYWVSIVNGGIKDVVGNTITPAVTKKFSTGSNINGGASDTTKPFIMFASANTYSVDIQLSEPVKSGGGANAADNVANWTLENPTGVVVSLTGKTITYIGYMKTVRIEGLSLSPGQTFQITASTNIQDLNGNAMDTTGTPAKNIFSGTAQNSYDQQQQQQSGNSNYNMSITPIMVMPITPIASSTSNYRVEFQASSTIPVSGTIQITFPSGFSFNSSCATVFTGNFDNNDINGPAAGAITYTLACNSVAGTITLTTVGGAISAGEMVRLELQGIINHPVPKDFNSDGYTATIRTFNASNTLLETKTTMPFFLQTAGVQSITGFVFDDNGAGSGGVAGDNIKNGSEAGVSGVRVCSGGMGGFRCVDTNSSGAYTFDLLNDGHYFIDVMPPATGTNVLSTYHKEIDLVSSGPSPEACAAPNASRACATGVNFAMKAAAGTITVNVTGGTAGKQIDVFAFAPFNPMAGGSMRTATLTGGTITVVLPVDLGTWSVGLGPAMSKDAGSTMQVPDMDFMPPKPQDIVLTSGSPTATLSFTLQAANRTIIGKVIDGSGVAIPNVFIGARPSVITDAVGFGGMGQTDSAGLFNVKVVNGNYLVEAFMPGMPPAAPVQVSVQNDTSNSATDNNATADVYSNGSLVTGVGITLKIAKDGNSISGKVMDDQGNAIPFAHVSGELIDGSGNPLGSWRDAPTDSTGSYTLYVFNGIWRLRAFAPGFGELPSITVTMASADQSGKNIQASTASLGTVSGTVFIDTNGNGSADTGEGVSGAFVGVHGSAGGNGGPTNSDGTYSLKVTAGSGYVADGFIPGKGPLAQTAPFSVGTTTPVTKNLSIGGVGTVAVTITGITDAFVDVRDASGRGFGTGSNTNGVYTLTLPASAAGVQYTIKAGGPQYGQIGSQTVTLTTSHTANSPLNVAFTAPTLVTVSGTLSSANASCIDNASIFITDRNNGRMTVTNSNTSGVWSLQVPSGNYFVGAGKPSCIDSAAPSVVTVGSSNVTGVDRTLNVSDATISGRVLLNSANTTVETKVVADNGSGKIVVVPADLSATGSNNNYSLPVTAGTWSVKAYADGYSSTAVSVTVASGGTASQNLTLTAIAGYTIAQSKSGTIDPQQGGRVVNDDIGSNFEITFPAGGLGSTSNDASVVTRKKTSISSTQTAKVVGTFGIEITPKDSSGNSITSLSSSEGAVITLPYSDADVTAAGVTESQIVISRWSQEKQSWEPLKTTVDTVNNVAVAETTKFSDFALTGPTSGSAPQTPAANLRIGSIGTNAIQLQWDQDSEATGYNLYRDTSSGGAFPRLGSDPTVSGISTLTYNDSGLSACTTYYYKIATKNDSGESGASSAVSGQTTGCGAGGGGNTGGGGGGSSVTTTPTPTPSPSASATPLASASPTPGASVSPSFSLPSLPSPPVSSGIIPPGKVISHYLTKGLTSDEVKTLQEILSKDPDVYPEGIISGFFGSLTERAVMRFQTKHGIEQTGTVGPKTRAKIKELFGQVEPPLLSMPPLPVIPGLPGAINRLTKALRFGMRDNQIRSLQEFLAKDSEVYPEGIASGYFGPLTLKAVQRFQLKYGIVADESDPGYGYVGPKTRAKINEMIGE